MAASSTPRSATWRRSVAPDPARPAAHRARPCATASTRGIWRDVVDRTARRGDRAPLRRRHRARRGRAPTRLIGTFAVPERPVAGPEPLLPLPPDRQRHRRVAGAVGGMGAVTDALARAATAAGAEIVTGAGRQRDPRRRRRRRGRPGTTARASTPSRPGTCWRTSPRGCCGSCSASDEDAADQAGGRPAQDQLPARPAAAAEVRRRPGRRLRRHPAPRRGLQPARGGVRRRGRRPAARP